MSAINLPAQDSYLAMIYGCHTEDKKNCLTDFKSSDIRVLRGKAFLLFEAFPLLNNLIKSK